LLDNFGTHFAWNIFGCCAFSFAMLWRYTVTCGNAEQMHDRPRLGCATR
jgi:hypothetical protein